MIAIRVPRALKIVAGVYVAYLALMLLVAMPAINILAPKFYRQQTGQTLTLGKIALLNPFTLSVTVRAAASTNTDGSPFWSLDKLHANLSLASIWQRHVVLDALVLQGLDLQIAQKSAERYNFSDILEYRRHHFPPAPAQPASTDTDSGFAIDIHHFSFSARHLGIEAPHWREPLALAVKNTQISVDDFSIAAAATDTKRSTVRTGAIDIALDAIDFKSQRAQQPFATQWQKLHIAIAALRNDGTEQEPLAVFVVTAGGGQLGVKANIALGTHSGSGTVTLRNVSLLPVWEYLAPKLQFTTQRAALDGELHFALNWADTLRYTLRDSRLNVRDVVLQSNLDADTGVAFSALQLENIAVDSAQPRAQVGSVVLDKPALKGWNNDARVSLAEMFAMAPAEEKEDSPPWQIQVDDIAIRNGEVQWRSSQLDELPLALAPLDIHATNFHWPDAAPLQLEVKSTLNSQTTLALNGSIITIDKSGTLNGDINNLPLSWCNNLLQQQMRAAVASGTLNTHVQIKLENAQPVAVQSDGAINQLELQSLPDKRKLAAWKSLQWRQLALAPTRQAMTLQRVEVTEPWLQFRINADGTNNFQNLMQQQKAEPQKSAAPAPKSAPTPTPTPKEKSPAQSPTQLPQQSPPQSKEKPWQFAINTVHIDKGVLDFRDSSLTRALRTNITDLTGDIKTIASRGNAKVALKGTVDGYAPVALSGTLNPFAAIPAMEIALDITNLDLATLTPYSGTYAGYEIDSGRLSVELVYTLENNRIKGTNHIVINQMQLGKQVTGPRVMDLPLRFAIYLLTDANGVMDLGVDVTGNVDDPDFSVGSIIWKALRNLIVKTATSPFRALARIGGGDRDDLDRVEFGDGSDRIRPDQNEKLRILVAALEKKSALKVEVTGHVSPSHDIEALRDNDLSAALIAQGGVTAADIQQQSKNWQREVGQLFAKRFPDRKSEKLAPMQMNDAMRDNVELPSSALQELANRRALAVKQLLVTDLGLPVERASLKPVDLGADKTPGAKATLEVN